MQFIVLLADRVAAGCSKKERRRKELAPLLLLHWDLWSPAVTQTAFGMQRAEKYGRQ